MKEFLEQIMGNELNAEQINYIGKQAQEQFGISAEAADQLKFAILMLGKTGLNYVFEQASKR